MQCVPQLLGQVVVMTAARLKTVGDALDALKNLDNTAGLELYSSQKWACAYVMRDAKTWDKKGIEGPLLIVRNPFCNSFEMILSSVDGHGVDKKGLMRMEILASWELERQKQFVFFRAQDAVYGLWFQKEEQAQQIHDTLEGVVHQLRNPDTTPVAVPPPAKEDSRTRGAKEESRPSAPKEESRPAQAVKAWLTEDDDEEEEVEEDHLSLQARPGVTITRAAVKAALLASIESGDLVNVVFRHLKYQK